MERLLVESRKDPAMIPTYEEYRLACAAIADPEAPPLPLWWSLVWGLSASLITTLAFILH